MKLKLLDFLKSKNLSSKTISIYYFWMNKYLEKYNVIERDLHHFIIESKEKYSINSQRLILIAISYLFEYNDIAIKIKTKSPQRVVNLEIVSYDDYLSIEQNYFASKYKTSIFYRNIAKILWKTGLRSNELINLKWSNINSDYIKIKGKGNKYRFIPYQKDLFKNFERKSEYVFSINNKKISYSYLYKIIKSFEKIINKKISPHSFRHGYATRLLQNGVPLFYVSDLLGHSNVNTTMMYLHIDLNHKIKTLENAGW